MDSETTGSETESYTQKLTAQSVLKMVKRTILDAPKCQTAVKTRMQPQPKSSIVNPTSDSDSERSVSNPFQSDSDESFVPDSCEEDESAPHLSQAVQVSLEDEISQQVPGQSTNEPIPEAEAVTATTVRRAIPGKLDKKQFCFFCKAPILKIARHLASRHCKEPEVAKLLAFKDSKTRYKDYLLGINKLKNKGNFLHNVEELQKGGCEIVVAKRPSKERPASDFLPCMYCYGFFVGEELWKHVINCECREERGECYEHRKTMSISRALLQSACIAGDEEEWLNEVRKRVLPRMTQDEICGVIKKDMLILRFGSVLIKKLGTGRVHDISQRMRQLGRLLLKLKEIDPHKESLSNFISGEAFDTVIRGTEEVCGVMNTDDGRRAFKTPSLAVRLGHLLTKVGNVKRGWALRCQNEDNRLAAETFLSLVKSEWTDTVSSCALNTLKRRKDQKVQILPLTTDLVKVREYMVKEMTTKAQNLLSNPDYTTWRTLAQVTMARLILFNKRRGGEVSRLLLKTYKERPKWADSMNREILSSLQGLELALTKRLDLIEVPGKKNRKVPILVTQEAKMAMETLSKTRDSVGVPQVNPFFFASKSVDGYLNSWQAMKAVVDNVAVEHPMNISSTRLRKYIATVCQLFDLKEGEMEWLANHMGHELHIHRDFYRLHESTVEIAKVSRVLMAIDSGDAMKYSGKKLSEIAIDDMAFEPAELGNEEKEDDNEEKEDDNEENEDANEENEDTNKKNEDANEATANIQVDPHLSESDSEKLISVRRKRSSIRLDSSSDEESAPAKKKKMQSCSLNQIMKTKWTTVELFTLKSVFKTFIQDKVYPSGKALQKAISDNECLKGRSVAQLRSKLQHLMR